MARVNVSQPYDLSREEVRAIVEDVADDICSQYGLRARWQGEDCVHFKRPGVTGELNIHNDEVTINLDLGIMLSAYAPTIKQELKKAMAKRLS